MIAWAGLLVVFVAFAVGLVLLYRMVLEDHGPDIARRAIAFLAFAPGAFFYTAAYPEALLLAGTVGCLWALRHERWLLAGLAGCVAAVAQVPGSLLVSPFAWEYLRRRRRRLGPSLLWGLLIPLGPATWLAHLSLTTGELLAPVSRANKFWAHYYAWPWDTVSLGVARVLGGSAIELLDLLNLTITLAALGASFWALRAGHTGWGIWSLAVLALYLSVPSVRPFDGMLRYCLPIVPLWLLAARVVRSPALEGGVIGGLAAVLGLLTALYVNGYWIA
ncbi:MAG: hypothetical protein HY329_18475 [Chloroflexi bacterium]|nr:hypothetical protein [Chloroflexota bacterium]